MSAMNRDLTNGPNPMSEPGPDEWTKAPMSESGPDEWDQGPMKERGPIGEPPHRKNAGYKGVFVLRYQDQRGDGIERGI